MPQDCPSVLTPPDPLTVSELADRLSAGGDDCLHAMFLLEARELCSDDRVLLGERAKQIAKRDPVLGRTLGALCTEQGWGCSANPDKAMTEFRCAAADGCTVAAALMADTDYGSDDPAIRAAGERSLRDLWEKGLAEAGTYIGRGFAERGEFQDAVSWYERAAERGSARAEYFLASELGHGRGVTRDRARAFGHMLRAARAGLREAIGEVGRAIEDGWGTGVQLTEAAPSSALAWYAAATAMGDAGAAARLAWVLRVGKICGKDAVKARELAAIAAQRGSTGGCYLFGLMLRNGEGGDRNPLQALAMFEAAAKGGRTDAMVAAGKLLIDGAGATPDLARAGEWIRKAAEAKDPEGMLAWSDALSRGSGVAADQQAARQWLQAAAKAGSTDAAARLRVEHERAALLQRAFSTIALLANGNGVTRGDLQMAAGDVSESPATFDLSVAIEWQCEEWSKIDSIDPSGSKRAADRQSAEAHIRLQCEKAAAASETAASLARIAASDPKEWFQSIKRGDRVGSFAATAHWVVSCSECGGAGAVACTHLLARPAGMMAHAINCYSCNGTAQVRCYSCGGTGRNAWDGSRCSGCGGGGWTRCTSCDWTGKIPCPSCGGSGAIRCGACNGTGWFTKGFNAWLTASPKRSWSQSGSTQARTKELLTGFDAVRAISYTTSLSPKVTHRPGRVDLHLEATLKHVELAISIKGNHFHFDALGSDLDFVRMPEFLDTLLWEDAREMRKAVRARDWPTALRTAQGSRVGCAVLQSLSERKLDVDAICRKFSGAVSSDFVSEMRAATDNAWRHIGRNSTRPWWIGATVCIPVAASAPILMGIDLPAERMLNSAGIIGVPYTVFMLLAVFGPALTAFVCVWTLAGRAARRALHSLIGPSSEERVRHGWWPVLVLAVSVLAVIAAGDERTRQDDAQAKARVSAPR